jgi:A/G-specific adenine glycosylase
MAKSASLDVAGLQTSLLSWYAQNARDLPWRRTADPYAILVSEIMLQQTQVDRVIPKYLAFLEAFPTLQALAAAEPGSVIRLWAGLGYNSRAVRLHQLAQQVVDKHAGNLPVTVDELRSLPGIGPYTASAVACFAFGAPSPVFDTNVYRVVSRVAFGVSAPSRHEVEPVAAALLPAVDASAWQQGLMDVGATICSTSSPKCMLCPLREHCQAAPYLQSGGERHLAEASVPYAPKQSTFAGSTRYYRGRIVAALGTLPSGTSMSLDELRRTVEDDASHDKEEGWLRGLVDRLVQDGLVRLEGEAQGTVRVTLP